MPKSRNAVAFISYSSVDEATANDIVTILEAAGLNSWLGHRDILPGQDFAAEIEEAIPQCSIFILVFSSNSNDSGECATETDLAKDSGLTILPVRLDDTKGHKGWSYRLARSQWLKRSHPDFESLLVSRVRASIAERERKTRGPEDDLFLPTPLETQRIPDVQGICGREKELADITAALVAVKNTGSGRLILIRGESGVGKSILAETVARDAMSLGFYVAQTVCEPFHEGMSFFPIRELMRQLSRAETWQDEVASIYGAGSSEASMAVIAELTDADPAARRDALLGTLANIVFGRANLDGSTPLLLMVDDLERTDAGTTDSLLCLLARLHEGPVVVVGTYRTDVVNATGPSHPLTPLISAAGRSGSKAMSVLLRPLPREELTALVGAILGGATELPEGFLIQLWRETEGNPLFLREIVRALHDESSIAEARLVRVEGRWRILGDWRNRRTPGTVEEAIRARLDLMDAGARGELERASVIGRRFAFEVMNRLTDEGEESLLRHLEECLSLSLIQESPEGDEAYEFTHGKIREVLYASMTRTRQRMMHAKVADALMALRTTVSEDWDALIGEHLYQAHRYSEAVPLLTAAARSLLAISAASEAANVLEKAITASMQTDGEAAASVAELRLLRIEALVLACEYNDALDAAQQTLSDPVSTRRDQGWALDYIGDIEWTKSRFDAAFKAYEAAELIALAEVDSELELEVCADLSEAYERMAESRAAYDAQQAAELDHKAVEYLERQYALAQSSGDAGAKARAFRNKAKRLRRDGDLDGSIRMYERGLELTDSRVATHSVLISYAKTLRFVGRREESAALVRRVLDWSSQSGARRSLGIALHHQALLILEQEGPTDEVLNDLTRALSIHREIGYDRGVSEVQMTLGEWHARRGQLGVAVIHLRESMHSNPEICDSEIIEMAARHLDAIDEHLRSHALREASHRAEG
jgi:predicted ATPase